MDNGGGFGNSQLIRFYGHLYETQPNIPLGSEPQLGTYIGVLTYE